MSVNIAVVESLTIAELNAALSYSTVVTSPRFYTQQIADAALAADAMICEAVYGNPNHPRASGFYTNQNGILHAGLLTARAGPLATVVFVVTGGTRPGTRWAREWDPEEIEHEIRNPQSLTELDCHYALVGDQLFHNGAAIQLINGGSVSVNGRFPTFTKTSACQAADEHLMPVLCGTLALLFPNEGENVDAAGFYGGQFQDMRAAIASNQQPPSFRSMRQAA